MISRLPAAFLLGGWLLAGNCMAGEGFGPFKKAASQPLNEIWLTTGFETWHFDHNKGLNGHNRGWGLEYRFSSTASVNGGKFFNSDRHDSNYLGLSWYPATIGPFRFGAYAGLFDGYPRMQNGGAFAAVVPVVSVEYKRVGANLIIVPTIQDRLYGGISLQLKLKLY